MWKSVPPQIHGKGRMRNAMGGVRAHRLLVQTETSFDARLTEYWDVGSSNERFGRRLCVLLPTANA